jgi:hypothetical protein
MIVGIGTVAAQFLFWGYMFQIFWIVSLQCTRKKLAKDKVCPLLSDVNSVLDGLQKSVYVSPRSTP